MKVSKTLLWTIVGLQSAGRVVAAAAVDSQAGPTPVFTPNCNGCGKLPGPCSVRGLSPTFAPLKAPEKSWNQYWAYYPVTRNNDKCKPLATFGGKFPFVVFSKDVYTDVGRGFDNFRCMMCSVASLGTVVYNPLTCTGELEIDPSTGKQIPVCDAFAQNEYQTELLNYVSQNAGPHVNGNPALRVTNGNVCGAMGVGQGGLATWMTTMDTDAPRCLQNGGALAIAPSACEDDPMHGNTCDKIMIHDMNAPMVILTGDSDEWAKFENGLTNLV